MTALVNKFINQFQPDYLRKEDYNRLPHDAYVPRLSDIALPSIGAAISLIILRQFLDRYVFTPTAVYFGINQRTTKPKLQNNPKFEEEYDKCKYPTDETIRILSEISGLQPQAASAWFRRKRRFSQPTEVKRFQDASCHMVFYFIMSWYGISVLRDKPWFEKAINCWIDWPVQPVTDDIYHYYLLVLGFYLSAVYMLLTDHKRKDFSELFVHHVVTIFLMVTSFAYNLLRVGSLVLCIHDQVDDILCLAKILFYTKHHKLADFCRICTCVDCHKTWCLPLHVCDARSDDDDDSTDKED